MKTFLTLLLILSAGISSARAQWVNKPDPLFTSSILWSVQVVDANNIWALAYHNSEIIKTTNGGLTWMALPLNDTSFTNYGIESISVIDQNTAWIVAATGTQPIKSRVYKTSDGGASWQHQISAYSIPSPGGNWGFANHFFDANNGVTLGEKFIPITGSSMMRSAPEVLVTNNGGATWQNISLVNLPANAQGIYYRSFATANNSIWYIGMDGWVYRSKDRGLTWSASNPGFPLPVGNLSMTVAFSDLNNGLAASGSTLKRTTDGGNTWTTVNAVGSWNSYEITAIPGVPNTYISAGRYIGNAGSYITNDNGNTWTTLEATTQHFDIHFINSTTGWSGGYAKMLKFNGSALGISEETNPKNSFTIYPNPSKGTFQVTQAGTDAFDLEIYDLTGKKIMQQEGNRFGKNSVDLTGQKKGIYLLHILSGEERIIEKIVLQ